MSHQAQAVEVGPPAGASVRRRHEVEKLEVTTPTSAVASARRDKNGVITVEVGIHLMLGGNCSLFIEPTLREGESGDALDPAVLVVRAMIRRPKGVEEVAAAGKLRFASRYVSHDGEPTPPYRTVIVLSDEAPDGSFPKDKILTACAVKGK